MGYHGGVLLPLDLSENAQHLEGTEYGDLNPRYGAQLMQRFWGTMVLGLLGNREDCRVQQEMGLGIGRHQARI